MSVFYDKENSVYIFNCPHCGLFIQVGVNEVNCTIFRHGFYYEKNGNNITLKNQINPHASKEECEYLLKEEKIIGCGKPFKMVWQNDCYNIETCDYI